MTGQAILSSSIPTKSEQISKIEKDFQDLPGPWLLLRKMISKISKISAACGREIRRGRFGGFSQARHLRAKFEEWMGTKKRSVAGTLLSGVVEPRGLSLWFGRAGQME